MIMMTRGDAGVGSMMIESRGDGGVEIQGA
jgi:hypothetical protein